MSQSPTSLRRRRWHSPHPGLAGAAARIPGDARRVALELDGTVTTIDEAIGRIRAAVGAGYEVRSLGGCVLLREDPSRLPCNVWCVIRSDPAGGE